MYLCGSNNNADYFLKSYISVVICLKICTFVVATTTLPAFILPDGEL
ncbi:hypothetical protein HMPREF6485_1366 [Segatella buccae ATCC 33574]|uniref:Uncharacterized protein n=1 Tax=Segatella buccae ATCC 33574 TaxID=873513 RepID=E6K6W7_9BACT|nr:hypothetical protein HMPREF6485_1366 [Segatella buccae ATCC 33574]